MAGTRWDEEDREGLARLGGGRGSWLRDKASRLHPLRRRDVDFVKKGGIDKGASIALLPIIDCVRVAELPPGGELKRLLGPARAPLQEKKKRKKELPQARNSRR